MNFIQVEYNTILKDEGSCQTSFNVLIIISYQCLIFFKKMNYYLFTILFKLIQVYLTYNILFHITQLLRK